MGRLTLYRFNLHNFWFCLLPELLILKFNTPFYFGGTSTPYYCWCNYGFHDSGSVTMMSYQYEGLLKKANFKGGSGGRV